MTYVALINGTGLDFRALPMVYEPACLMGSRFAVLPLNPVAILASGMVGRLLRVARDTRRHLHLHVRLYRIR